MITIACIPICHLLEIGYPNNKFSLSMIYHVIGNCVFNSATHLVNEQSHSTILFTVVIYKMMNARPTATEFDNYYTHYLLSMNKV
jgi:hypothetical protein